jgi:hypothetical protein
LRRSVSPFFHFEWNTKLMKSMFLTALGLLTAISVNNALAQSFDHSPCDSLLQKFVVDGMVNYRGLQQNRELLAECLENLEKIDSKDFQSWPQDQQKAFWIDAYNIITIEGIVRNYPIKGGGLFSRMRFPNNSIRQISNFWDTVFIKVMGQDITLDDIEHEILRKEFKDPRIHFVLVCAAMGCPLLESKAFFRDDVHRRLERAANNFINSPEKVKLDQEDNVLYLSSIFAWYKGDFPASDKAQGQFDKYGKKDRGVVAFVTERLPMADAKYIIDRQPKIKYLDYDWSLNERR